MRIAKELKIHRCHKCGAPIDDADFTALGVRLASRYQIFFDYWCPDGACGYRGRYVVPLKGKVTCVNALNLLADQIDDDDVSHDAKIDWDGVVFE